MDSIRRVGVLLCVLSGSALAFACGGGSSGGFQSGQMASGQDAASPDDATTSSSDDGGGAPTGTFVTTDDGGLAPTGVVFDCKPGTYAGNFTTMVTNDGGGLLAFFSLNWTGSLSITLVGKVSNNGSGELPEPTLTIAPGAKLSGIDAYGGHFNADLTGQLDCPSKTLTATVADGNYNFTGGDAGGIMMAGSLSATYDGTMAMPMLTLGAMDLSSPQLMGTAAIGTWTATLQ
jgi:hypothetical protein